MALSEHIADWAERIRSGDSRSLARALTEVENRGPQADPLLAALFDESRRSWRIGVTGAPGAGKSTLVDALVAKLRSQDKTVAVVAVDPTSPFTRGAILGDRVRMLGHDSDPGVYIRSMATRGSLGGLAAATADALHVLEASGRDVIVIETVGVGQAEVDVVQLASVVAVTLTPGMGDDVQALKAGLMEIADVFALNKSDLPGADDAEKQIRAMLALRPPGDVPPPPIVRTIAPRGDGVTELLEALEARPPKADTEVRYWQDWLARQLERRLWESVRSRQEIADAATAIAGGRLNPYQFLDGGPKLHHLGIAVRSIDQALKVYQSGLGLEVAHRTVVEHEGVKVAMLPAGEPRLELLEPLNADSPIARFLDKRGEGLHHIAIETRNLAASVEQLTAAGARLVTDEIQIGAEGYRYVFLHPKSAGGVLIELIEN